MNKQFRFSLLVAKNVEGNFCPKEYLNMRVYAKVYKNSILSQKSQAIKR